MMAAANRDSDFFSGENLNAILDMIENDILNEEEGVFQDTSNTEKIKKDKDTATNVLTCVICNKSYKTVRGLERHTEQAHNIDVPPNVSDSDMVKIINKAQNKLVEDECLPFFDKSSTVMFDEKEITALAKEFNSLIQDCLFSPDKYHSKSFQIINRNMFDKSPKYIVNLALMEISNQFMFHIKKLPKKSDDAPIIKEIQPKEIYGLQYLSGYVFRKMYEKYKTKKCHDSSLQYSKILLGAKVEEDESQVLVNAKDRGGLWKVDNDTLQMFIAIETHFRKLTATVSSEIIESDVTKKIGVNVTVVQYFENIVAKSDCEINPEESMNLLDEIIKLFVKVRCFSLAKDLKEAHKVKKKAITKKKSLRTEIKKSTNL